jgi:proteasome lid subunit RPN8/RPN11
VGVDVGSLPAGSSPVTLCASAAALIHAQVQRSGNREACGLLFGTDGRITQATVARNVAADPWHRFEIDPAHLFDAHRRSRAGPARLIGCWHSHPNGQGEPSRHDREGVTDESWLWLIVAGGRIRAWRPVSKGLVSQGFAEAPLSIALRPQDL